jgi:type IV secretory pathway VirB6-like protein
MAERGCKLIKLLSIVLLSLIIYSCKPGCVEPYEFDSETVILESNPGSENIYGTYAKATGGQIANYTNTGLRTNGEPIIIQIAGSWASWEQIDSDKELKEADLCTICFKKNNSDNCLCQQGEISVPEELKQDKVTPNPVSPATDCTIASNQDDPDLCTCTQQHGLPTDLDVYFIAIDHQKKDGTPLTPDFEMPCKYNAGAGAYVGLFGSSGVDFPKRAYHLYSTQEACDIGRNSNNECVDEEGVDVTRYTYKSANNKIFIRDDHNGNDGSDVPPNGDSSNDEYHEAGELIKLIISDNYYSDNYGEYKITFLGGVIKEKGKGILEYIVGTVEDFVIGKPNGVGKREGGALEFLYKSLVQDSVFIAIVQMALILYVTFFGVGVLMGTVEISHKEMSSRVIKIALVIFFTTQTSWYWYNQIVVGFFKDGMDGVITIFMNLVDSSVADTSLINISQMDRASGASSQATRFSYIDYVIKKLLSSAVHKKIWSLLFGYIFGFIYIPCIYAAIGFFIYTALTAALIYITAILKMVVALGLGPLFILASLFSKTESSFKQWITFLAARSLEMIALFLVIYSFLVLIDRAFTDLLWIRACGDKLQAGLFSVDIIKTPHTRSFVEWMSRIVGVVALTFLLKMIIDKIPGVITELVAVSGAGAAATSATSLANSIMSSVLNGAKGAASRVGLPALGGLNQLRKAIARATGLDDKWDNAVAKLPRGPISRIRDSKIDSAIKSATKSGELKGLKGAALNQHIRQSAVKAMAKYSTSKDSSTSAALLGMSSEAVAKRLDKKLVQQPMKAFMKKEAQNIRNNTKLYGKEMRAELHKRTENWANKNLHVGATGAKKGLLTMEKNNILSVNNFINKQSQLSAKDAAKKFAGDADAQSKYLSNLNKNIAERKQDKEEGKGGVGGAISRKYSTAKSNTVGRLRSTLGMRDNYTPEMNKSKFLDQLAKEERRTAYKKQEQADLQGKGLGVRLLSKTGINTSKSLGQRFERSDKNVLKSSRKESQDGRNNLKKAVHFKENVGGAMKDINKNLQDNLERFGYKAGENGKFADRIDGAPSKAQLEKEARSQLDALSKRMQTVDRDGSTDNMVKSQESIRKAKEKVSRNNERLEKLKAVGKERDEAKKIEKDDAKEAKKTKSEMEDRIKITQKESDILRENTLMLDTAEDIAKAQKEIHQKDEQIKHDESVLKYLAEYEKERDETGIKTREQEGKDDEEARKDGVAREDQIKRVEKENNALQREIDDNEKQIIKDVEGLDIAMHEEDKIAIKDIMQAAKDGIGRDGEVSQEVFDRLEDINKTGDSSGPETGQEEVALDLETPIQEEEDDSQDHANDSGLGGSDEDSEAGDSGGSGKKGDKEKAAAIAKSKLNNQINSVNSNKSMQENKLKQLDSENPDNAVEISSLKASIAKLNTDIDRLESKKV